MRNKILVLVLALICLFAVSAVAAEVKQYNSSDFTKAQQAQILAGREGHKMMTTEGSKKWNTYKTTSAEYLLDDVKAPITCKADGYLTFICEGCADCDEEDFDVKSSVGENYIGKAIKVAVSAMPHEKSEAIELKKVTCSTDGYEKWYCAKCNDTFELKAGDDHLELKATGHENLSVEILGPTKATCLEKAYTYQVCPDCGEEVNKKYSGKLAQCSYITDEVYVTIETCNNAGLIEKTEVCSVCHKVKPAAPVTQVAVPQIKHNDKEDADNNLSMIFKDWYNVDLEKGTNDAGLAFVIPAYRTDVHSNEYGEEWTEDVIIVPAYDEKDAVIRTNVNGDYIIQAGKYTFNYVAATCYEEGSITIACENCDATVKYAIEKLEHAPYRDFEDSHIDDCTETYNVAFTCTHCNKYFEEVIGGKTEHKFGKYTDVKVQYQKNGLQKVEICEGDEYDEAGNFVRHYKEVQVNGVPVENVEDYAIAYCAPYYKVYFCENVVSDNHGWSCSATKLVEVKPAATVEGQHQDYKEVIKDKDYYKYEAEDCSKPGFIQYECDGCGNTVSVTIPQSTTHNITTWNIDKQATCKEAGSASAVCPTCKLAQYKTIPALSHKLDVEVEKKAADKCVDGYVIYGCKFCDETNKVIIPAVHSDNVPTECTYYRESDCTKQGVKEFECTICGNNVSVPLAPVEHKFEIVYEAGSDTVPAITPATCCQAAFYVKECEECKKKMPVFVGEAKGHTALSKEELETIRANALAGKLDPKQYIVEGTIDCEKTATGTKYCWELYTKWTEKNGVWTATPDTKCTYEIPFTLEAFGHDWSESKLDAVTGNYYVQCRVCDAIKTTEKIKPEYSITWEGTKGKVTLKNELASYLSEAWVRISYGFELSDGSYLAITTCMPITFEYDDHGKQVGGTFSFFALNTSLEYTGINAMVVDHYDAMSETIGSLVGNNYGMYIG